MHALAVQSSRPASFETIVKTVPFANPFWSRQFRQWHWISSALILSLMLLFSVTGFTLNHPDWFTSTPVTQTAEFELSADLQVALSAADSGAALTPALSTQLAQETDITIPRSALPIIEYEELILDLGGPGVDANLTIDLVTGEAFYERIDNGFVARLNDLHKGRDAGPVWGVMIDITALACLVFCVSGLGLLFINAKGRTLTWPLTSFGLVIPLIAYILFVHS